MQVERTSKRSYAFLEADHPLAFAHRGGDLGVENSRVAFENAAALGYQYIETDARATLDGIVLAYHDDRIIGSGSKAARVQDLAWAEIDASATSAPATLDELLRAFPMVRFNIDVKDDHSARCTVDVIGRNHAWDRVCLTSFSDRRTRRMKKPSQRDFCSSPGILGVLQLIFFPAIMSPNLRRHGCAQLPYKVGPLRMANGPLIRRCQKLGLALHVWTVNDEAAMATLLDAGVDGIMTDRLELLKSVLMKRHQWPSVLDGHVVQLIGPEGLHRSS